MASSPPVVGGAASASGQEGLRAALAELVALKDLNAPEKTTASTDSMDTTVRVKKDSEASLEQRLVSPEAHAASSRAGFGEKPSDSELTLVGALIILAWQAEQLSEGQVCRALNIDRLTARIQRDDLIQRGVTVAETMRSMRGI